MHENFRDAPRLCGTRQRNHVQIMTVHTAIGDESEQMKPMSARGHERFLGHIITRELAVCDRLVDPG